MSKTSKIDRSWSTLILLIGMVLSSALTLATTDWTEHLAIVPLVGLGGVLAGFLLGISRFPDWLTHIFGVIYGVAWTTFLVVDALPGDLMLREQVFALGNRISAWVYQAFTGGTGQDAVIFLLLLSALYWILGYNAAWNTYRRPQPWVTALPFGIVTIIVTHYYTGPAALIRYLGLYLLLALLYVGQAYIAKQKEVWREDRVAYDPTLNGSVLRASLLFAVTVMLLATLLPTTSASSISTSDVWQRARTPWETIEEEWRRLFSSIHGQAVEIAEPFGSTLSLGGPSTLEDIVVLDIVAPDTTRYYWRTSVYAIYDGREWRLPPGETTPLPPDEQVGSNIDVASRQEVTQTITNYLSGRQLLAGASQPVAFDREIRALVPTPEESLLEIYRASSVSPLSAGESYTVTSRVIDADATALRRAGSDYPDRITRLYLQLPGSLPQRVRTLAAEITAPGDTPYNKARLLESYLRSNITYDLTPPDFPGGWDYVDFLLFDSRRGYCDGYASAMVVMARSVGIPARLATGYGQGEYNSERGMFRVRENNAHSWPEIYFPGYGWVEFEPTASEDPLIRPESEEESAPPVSPTPSPPEESTDDPALPEDFATPMMDDRPALPVDQPSSPPPSWPRTVLLGTLVTAALALLATAGWWAAENLGFRRLPSVEQDYGRLLRFGRWLGRPLEGSDTPLEWMRDFAAMVPEAREQIARIVELRAVARFGRGDPRDPAADVAWAGVRSLLWRQLLWDQWPKRLGRRPRTCS
ncbi:MAG: transglutaminaseTgpA domain-containing protein [Chloroflexota bacterium]|nr:transglutaminaseTgpA domain-containing protein [Chloroflexota bacterium]